MANLWNWLKGLFITPPPVIAVVKPAEPVKSTSAKKTVRRAAAKPARKKTPAITAPLKKAPKKK